MKLIARTIIGLWFLFYGAALAQQYPGVAAGSVSVGSVVTNWLNGSGQAVPDDAANPHPVVIVGQCPTRACAINATGTGTTDATTATLAAAVGKTTYITASRSSLTRPPPQPAMQRSVMERGR